ncbi:MAG: HAD-IB family hydrolase [Microgenomates group bacterium]|nr:HAD-IB family hydrolase [Microgenomates group bacterium]
MKKIKKLAFFDQDNTIYQGFSMHDFYLFMADNQYVGRWIYDQHIKIQNLYREGKLNYRQAGQQVIQLTADALAGKNIKEVAKIGKKFLRNGEKIFSWVKPVLKFLEKNNFETYIISASAEPVVKAVGEHIQIGNYFASLLEIKDGYYTGKVINYLDFEEKQKKIKKILGKNSHRLLKIGFGDSTGDIDMLSEMNQAFIINPHQKEILDLAKKRGWLVAQEAKTIIEEIKKTLKEA